MLQSRPKGGPKGGPIGGPKGGPKCGPKGGPGGGGVSPKGPLSAPSIARSRSESKDQE